MIIFSFLDGFDDFWQIFGIFKWLIHENFHVSISMYKRPKIEKRGVPARKKTFYGEFKSSAKKILVLGEDGQNRKKHPIAKEHAIFPRK